MVQTCTRLMKFKFANMNLANIKIVESVCQICSKNNYLILLNLSNASLLPLHLMQIAESISLNGKNLRNLNLSYNQLCFDSKNKEDNQYSLDFMNYLSSFFNVARFINHVDFSHMNLPQDQILQLIEMFQKCQFLLSIHLSDNKILEDTEFFKQCLRSFGIQNHNERSRPNNSSKQYDYQVDLRKYLCIEQHDRSRQANCMKPIQEQLILKKQQKFVQQFRAINANQVYEGIGRALKEENIMDRFVLTRILNQSQLIFNQEVASDGDQNIGRFFKRDAAARWKLSKQNECYLCDKHQYLLISYERTQGNTNDLIEIKDHQILSKLKNEFDVNYKHLNSMTPLICGTIVNKAKNQGKFERKLQMLRAPLYSLLSICQSKEFTERTPMIQALKLGVIQYLQYESNYLKEDLALEDHFIGWQNIIRDKCRRNELMDITSINMPNFEWNQDCHNFYFYGGFFKAGYHQFLIYDPLLERAFCKDFILNLNQREDIFPEYPIIQGVIMARRITNVWHPWKIESEAEKLRAFQKHRKATDNFYINGIIKDAEDANNCIEIMRDSFDIIKIYQKHLQLYSEKYPLISWDRLWWHLEQINETSEALVPLKKLQRAQVEVSFIRATRDQKGRGLQGGLARAALYEMIIRIAIQWIREVYSSKAPFSEHLKEFVDIYISPFYHNSDIILHREEIRASRHVTQLIFDNEKSLDQLYYKIESLHTQVTLQAVQNFLLEIMKPHPETLVGLSVRKIEECFAFSQMTVLNEEDNMDRYGFLAPVEFKEMLCRISLQCIQPQSDQDIQYKTQQFLHIIWDTMYRLGTFNKKDHPLAQIDQEDFKIV